uniref:Uncharacterized protein n=1 Tax=Saimiri boliviensis boliviensis TaxID=39432 RepID=A0A2K6UBB9_SAIBB
MQQTQILLVIPSHLQQLGHLALKSPVSKEGQSPLPDTGPLRTPTCLPIPEDPLPS